MPWIPREVDVGLRVARGEAADRELRKVGPEPWLYLGTWPTEPFTQAESPPYLNGYDYSGGDLQRVRVRWDQHGRHEWAGKWDVAGAASGDLACTLPELWRPDADYDFPVILEQGATFVVLRQLVETTGDVTLFWT